MLRRVLIAALLATLLGLSACATTPPPGEPAVTYRLDLPPHQVATLQPPPPERVRWGGMIVEVRNRENYSEIEVLAYPLDRKLRPKVKAPTEGRFIAVMPGYIEAYDWPQGRFLTVHGNVAGTREGLIDEKLFVYPVVEVEGAQLWPAGYQHNGPHFSFGIGVGVGD